MRDKKSSPRYLTTTQAARRVHLSPSTLLRAVQKKKLKAFCTPGGHFRIDPASLETFLKASGAVEGKRTVLLARLSPEDKESLLSSLRREESLQLSETASDLDKPTLILLETDGSRSRKGGGPRFLAQIRRWCGLS